LKTNGLKVQSVAIVRRWVENSAKDEVFGVKIARL
jgi:hypothetical protein